MLLCDLSRIFIKQHPRKLHTIFLKLIKKHTLKLKPLFPDLFGHAAIRDRLRKAATSCSFGFT